MKTQAKRSHAKILRSLVVYGNERTDIGDILQIARSEAKRKEHIHHNVDVKCIRYIPECEVYVAIYEVSGVQKPGVGNRGDYRKQ